MLSNEIPDKQVNCYVENAGIMKPLMAPKSKLYILYASIRACVVAGLD